MMIIAIIHNNNANNNNSSYDVWSTLFFKHEDMDV
jgi:hypothetical protein